MGTRWFQKFWRYPRYWHLEAAAAVGSLTFAAVLAGRGDRGLAGLWLGLAMVWGTLAARGRRRCA